MVPHRGYPPPATRSGPSPRTRRARPARPGSRTALRARVADGPDRTSRTSRPLAATSCPATAPATRGSAGRAVGKDRSHGAEVDGRRPRHGRPAARDHVPRPRPGGRFGPALAERGWDVTALDLAAHGGHRLDPPAHRGRAGRQRHRAGGGSGGPARRAQPGAATAISAVARPARFRARGRAGGSAGRAGLRSAERLANGVELDADIARLDRDRLVRRSRADHPAWAPDGRRARRARHRGGRRDSGGGRASGPGCAGGTSRRWSPPSTCRCCCWSPRTPGDRDPDAAGQRAEPAQPAPPVRGPPCRPTGSSSSRADTACTATCRPSGWPRSTRSPRPRCPPAPESDHAGAAAAGAQRAEPAHQRGELGGRWVVGRAGVAQQVGVLGRVGDQVVVLAERHGAGAA